MPHEALQLHTRPKLKKARLVLGFTGWMDGGDVSTGTIEYLIERLGAQEIARIDGAEFYLYSFPGSMEMASLFRPYTTIENGEIREFEEPANTIYCNQKCDLLLFLGKEPHLRWPQFADCLFVLAARCHVEMIYFVGSVAGLVPHTRGPRFYSTISDASLRPLLKQHDLAPSNYEGPASFITYLLTRARAEGVAMATLVAEIPGYIDGRNVKCIEATTQKLLAMLDLFINVDELEAMAKEFEVRVEGAMQRNPELAAGIERIEKDYDALLSDEELGGLREWFEKQNIRLD